MLSISLNTLKLIAFVMYVVCISYRGFKKYMRGRPIPPDMKEDYSRIFPYVVLFKGLFVHLCSRKRRQFTNKGLIILDYYGYWSIAPSLNSFVALAWLCERMQVDIKIEAPRTIWRHFEGDNIIINTTKTRSSLYKGKYRYSMGGIGWLGRFFVSSEYGYKILSRLAVKEAIKKSADEWLNQHIKGDWVAVHYRGTDVRPTTEMLRRHRYRIVLDIDSYVAYLQEVLDKQSGIFVCSDQAQFVGKMHAAFPRRVFARDIERSYDDQPIHFTGKPREGIDNFEQEKDALLDILVLAKARLIYTTGSGFVDVVRYFNPNVKIVSLDGREIGRGENNMPIPRKDLLDKLRFHYKGGG